MNPVYNLIPFNYLSDGERLLIKRLGKTLSFSNEEALAVMHLLQLMNQLGSFDQVTLQESASENIPPSFTEELVQLLEVNGFIRRSDDPPSNALAIPYHDLERLVKKQRFIFIGINRLSFSMYELLKAYSPDVQAVFLSYGGLDLWQEGDAPDNFADISFPFEEWMPSQTIGDDDFIIATTVFGNKNALRDLNQELHQLKLIYLPVLLLDYQLEVGPIYMPGKTPCYECVYKRFISHYDNTDEVNAFYQMIDQNSPHLVHFSDDVLFTACGGVATLQVLNYLTGNYTLLQSGYQLDWNLSNNTSTSHRILKNPLCKVCASKTEINSTNYFLNMIQVDDKKGN